MILYNKHTRKKIIRFFSVKQELSNSISFSKCTLKYIQIKSQTSAELSDNQTKRW